MSNARLVKTKQSKQKGTKDDQRLGQSTFFRKKADCKLKRKITIILI